MPAASGRRGPAEAGGGAGEERGVNARGAPGPGAVRRAGRESPGQGPERSTGAGLGCRVCVLSWPLTVRIQGNNKTFRKRTAWPRKGRLAASSGRRALGRRFARSVLAAPVDGLPWRLRRLLRLLGALLLRELLARGNGVLLGPPLGLGGRLQAAALQHLHTGRPQGSELGPGSGTPSPVPR